MANPIITFTSDFGLDDWFVGVVHGVLHDACAAARIVDLSHTIDPGDIRHAAFVLEAACPDFARGTVHLAVVDPGVGTKRRPIAVAAHGQFFVGPDNGVLEWAFADSNARVHLLAEEGLFRHPVSRTFHGRDVFAPVAARLAEGLDIATLGPSISDPVRLDRPTPRHLDGEVRGSILFVDRFGNALTNITAGAIEEAFPGRPPTDLVVQIGTRRITGISHTYGESPLGTLVAVMGSSGHLEIAQVAGNAASRFGIGAGDQVVVR